MGQVATTIENQIEKLESRGMIIPDHNKAREYLLDIGYYRLGFYWYYFERDKEHNFKDNTNLDDIIELYYLDIDLKNLLLKYIYRIEVHFRTQLIYYMSNEYPNNPRWYRNSKYLSNYVVNENERQYSFLKLKNKTIIKHHEKYIHDSFAPAWKTLEFFSFGQILKNYTSLKNDKVKLQIAESYRLRDVNLLSEYFTAIINIRNICSHSNVLFDYNQPLGINRIPNKRFRLKNRNTTNLNASFRLILFILSKVSINRTDELEKAFYEIVNKGKQNEKLKDIIDVHINLDLNENFLPLHSKSAPLYILL